MVRYLLTFALVFCVLYFGTQAIIGLSSPVGMYSSFVHHYLDFIPAFRNSLLHASKYFLSVFGYSAYQSSEIQLRMVGGQAVQLVYSCLGIGVTSFWLAFVAANSGSFKKKLLWGIGGAAVLYIINVIRISLTLLGNNAKWQFPFGWDNHTWFNIASYLSIFCMIWLFDRYSATKKTTVQ